MLLTVLALLTTSAFATDSNNDGCEDSYFDANSACVAESAVLGSGTTVGASADVGKFVTVGQQVTISAGVTIADRATVGGQGIQTGPFVVGVDSIIGRSANIGTDNQIGSDTTFARSTTTDTRVQTGNNAAVGYASDIGADVTIADGVVIGALAQVGNFTQLQTGAILARGVQIADASGTGDNTTISGVIGPAVSIGTDVSVASGARVRKRSTIGNGVTISTNSRIGRDVTLEANATIGQDTRIGAGAIVRAGAVIGNNVIIGAGAEIAGGVTIADGTRVNSGDVVEPADINPPGTLLIASSSFIDENPPAGWTQCMGFTNTAGDDVANGLMNGCLPTTRLRVRMWNDSGVLIDDSFMSGFSNTTEFSGRRYLGGGNVGRNIISTTLWGSASFFYTTTNLDACNNDVGGSAVHFSTGNGNVAGVAPGHSNHSEEIGRNCNGSGYLGYTVAFYN